MRSNYSQVIWGIVFVFLNINIGPIDILPNFLGYIFISLGLSSLVKINPIYKKGSAYSLVLAMISLILVFYPINITKENLTPSNFWTLGITSLFSILNLVVFYSICKGIYTEAEKITNNDLMHSAKIRWNWMLYCTCISIFLSPFILTMDQSIQWINLAISIVLVMLAFSIVFLLKKARERFSIDISEHLN